MLGRQVGGIPSSYSSCSPNTPPKGTGRRRMQHSPQAIARPRRGRFLREQTAMRRHWWQLKEREGRHTDTAGCSECVRSTHNSYRAHRRNPARSVPTTVPHLPLVQYSTDAVPVLMYTVEPLYGRHPARLYGSTVILCMYLYT